MTDEAERVGRPVSTGARPGAAEGKGRADAGPGPGCRLCGGRPDRPFAEQEAVTWWKCPDCGLYFVHPQPHDRVLDALYRSAYYEQPEPDAPERARAVRRWSERVEAIESVRPPGSALHALDVGCGRGEFLGAARDRGWRVIGMEVTLAALGSLSTDLRRRSVVAELAATPFRAATFDLVALFDVLEHVRDPVDALRAVEPLLRPDGGLVITTPNAASWKARIFRSRWKYFEFERYLHLYHFTPDTLARTLEAAGFRVARWLRRRGMPLFVVAERS